MCIREKREKTAAMFMNDTTVKPDVTVDVTMTTSSLKPRLFVENEMQTNSTSVNITGLEHFTEYLVKVYVTQSQTLHSHIVSNTLQRVLVKVLLKSNLHASGFCLTGPFFQTYSKFS